MEVEDCVLSDVLLPRRRRSQGPSTSVTAHHVQDCIQGDDNDNNTSDVQAQEHVLSPAVDRLLQTFKTRAVDLSTMDAEIAEVTDSAHHCNRVWTQERRRKSQLSGSKVDNWMTLTWWSGAMSTLPLRRCLS